MTWIAIATPRLYCPATLFDILLRGVSHIATTRGGTSAVWRKKTHQVTIAGYAPYAPDTTRKVPKYFAPMFSDAILITNPVKHKSCPHRMNGERRLTRSDHTAHTMTVAAVKGNAGCKHSSNRAAGKGRGRFEGTYFQRRRVEP